MLPTLCVVFLLLPFCGFSSLSRSLCVSACVAVCGCVRVGLLLCIPVCLSRCSVSTPHLCLLPNPRTQATPDCTPMLYSRLRPCLKHSPLHPPHTGGAVRAGSRLQQDGALLLHEGAGRLLPRQRAGLVRRLAPRAPPVGLLLPPQVECLIRAGACGALLRSCFCFCASGGRHGLRTWDDSDRCQGGLAGTVGL